MRIYQDANIVGDYRYSLIRVWDTQLPWALWVMLNPSTADHKSDDPALRKVMGFSQRAGFGGLKVVNLYAYRSKDPDQLRKLRKEGVDIVGNANDLNIERELGAVMNQDHPSPSVVVAWGGKANISIRRTAKVLAMIRKHTLPQCLGRTTAGHPKHPLYLPYGTPFGPYMPPRNVGLEMDRIRCGR